MSTKLKNMKLTSVDLVRAGANQEADICLYKSANPPAETTIDLYKSAITESLQSIVADESLSVEEKNSLIEKSIGQYHDRMTELFSAAPAEEPQTEEPLEKADGEPEGDEDGEELVDFDFEDEEPVDKSDRYDEIEYVSKANPYHAADGKFTTAGGGGGSNNPFQSGNAHAVLSEMPRHGTVTIRTDKKEVAYTKRQDGSGSSKSTVWTGKNSSGQSINISQGNLADIINSGGNKVFGKIQDIRVG